jgi:hypothetical protein
MPGAQAGFGAGAGSDLAPFIAAAERFNAAARTYMQRAASGSAPAAAEAAQNFSDFLRDEFAQARLPWNAGFGPAAGGGTQASSASDWPALGPLREHQQRWQRMGEAARRIDDAQRRLQRLWSDALRQAAADFATQLQPQASVASDATSLRQLYDAWIGCAEDAYARTAHSEAFCNAQADLVNAGSQWRQELQAGIEHWAKLLDLPTRSEINTLAQRLRSMEQHSMEQQRHAAAPAVPVPQARQKKARRKNARPKNARPKNARRKAKR